MKINFSFQNLPDIQKQELKEYVTEEKLRGLTRLLQHGNFDLANLDIRAECQQHHKNIDLKIYLKIKNHVLVAEVAGYGIIGAFDLALEKIIDQLRKVESIKHTKVLHKIRRNRLK
jgi:ribosome-associated translation inhibitor RaiA